jgi:U4/U6 small nuclear ribonucleoprotein PRP3
MHRLRLQFGDEKAEKMKSRAERERKHAAHMEKLEKEAAMDPNLVPVGERPSAARGASAARPIAPLDEIPEVEWWDKEFLQNGTYDDVTNGNWHVNMDKFNVYVEHPVPIQPPLDAPAPAPQPLVLTKAEQKKLRTQRRVAREKEKQEMIKQGLIEPPKPKVKISNLMRVLKDEAVLDPTAIEREVREQMAEREQAHQDRNLARMLTPAERREKKMRKLLGSDAAGEVHMHVYRVEDMSNRKNRFKVDINAQENHLTGVGLITDDFSVIVVEGTSKAVRRYDKLMMRRIDWNASLNEHDDMEVDEHTKNKCTRVWKGTSTTHALKRFTFETLSSEAAARRYLTEVKLEHLWDAAFACEAVEDEND